MINNETTTGERERLRMAAQEFADKSDSYIWPSIMTDFALEILTAERERVARAIAAVEEWVLNKDGWDDGPLDVLNALKAELAKEDESK